MANLKEELRQHEWNYGITNKEYCSREEVKEIKKTGIIPVDVLLEEGSSNNYYRNIRINLSEKEIDKLLNYRQTNYLRTISYCTLLVTILIIICFLSYIWPLLSR